MFTLIMQDRDPNALLREPIVAASIELEEQAGMRYLSKVVNCPQDQIKVDMPVRLTWVEEEDGRHAPAFEPAGEARN
jgi:uncharacterized OB-fold protein